MKITENHVLFRTFDTNVIKLMNGKVTEKCEDNLTPNYRITVQLYAKIPSINNDIAEFLDFQIKLKTLKD